jgi:hypothetical protein
MVRRAITSTSITENPNARGLAEEEEEDFLSSIVHFVLCIRHLFTWGIRLLLQDPLPLGDGQSQVLDSTCRTGRTRLSPRRDGGGAGRVDDDPAFNVATIGIIGGGEGEGGRR